MAAEQDKGALWRLDGDEWLQQDNDFRLVAVDGVEPAAQLTDLDYLAGARHHPDGNSLLPRQFAFSPVSGRPLPAVKAMNWLPPCAGDNGQRVSAGDADQALEDLLLQLDQHWSSGNVTMQSGAERLKPPATNGLVFFSADAGGYRDALFALGRGGALWLWQRGSGEWLQLKAKGAQLSRHAFEHWATAVVTLPGAIGSDVVLAGEQGADILRIDPLRLTYDVDRLPGSALGAPGRLDEFALVPQKAGSDCRIAIRTSRDGWSHIPVAAGDDALAGSTLAAPFTSINGTALVWIGQHGWLQVSRNGDDLSASWNRWSSGREARPVLGPPYRTGEGDWQLLQDASSRWHTVLVDAGMPQEHPAPRASVCTGRRVFQLDVPVDRPWDRYDEERHHGPKHVLHPFLETRQRHILLGVRVPDQRKALLSFYDNGQPQQVEYCIKSGGRPHVYALETARPWNAQWFVHDDALWLWVDDRGALMRWSRP